MYILCIYKKYICIYILLVETYTLNIRGSLQDKMKLNISTKVKNKLHEKHGVNEEKILQCFSSREKGYLEDIREDHKTDPATLWFIAETDYGEKLKIVFIFEEISDEEGNMTKVVTIKTAYAPNSNETYIYEKHA